MNAHDKEPFGLNEFSDMVDQVGGMEEYYKKSKREELEHLQREVDNPSYCADVNTLADFKKNDQCKIENIQALFRVSELFEQAGVSVNFIGLTHTMQDYPVSVILPMKELLEQGKVEEALQLYHQPRRYHR